MKPKHSEEFFKKWEKITKLSIGENFNIDFALQLRTKCEVQWFEERKSTFWGNCVQKATVFTVLFRLNRNSK